MGWRDKRRERVPGRRLIEATPDELAAIGQRSFGGDSPNPIGLQLTELDHHAMHALEVAGYPTAGTPAYADYVARIVAEATELGERTPPLGIVGAFAVVTNCVTPNDHPAFLPLVHAAVDALRRDGVAYASIPPFALDHWTAVHGYGTSGPKGFPPSISFRELPPEGHEPDVAPLAVGERRKLSMDGPEGQGRSTFAEHRPDGAIVAVVEGIDLGDGQHKTWERGVEAASYPAFLRELGDTLGFDQHWMHPDLAPYIPCSTRTRAEMRAEAARIEL